MKKLIYLLLLLAVAEVKAQESVTFKMKYAPGRNYNGTMQMNMDCKAALSGDSQVIEKLSQQGITQPISFSMDMKMAGVTQTGPADVNNTFPLTMNYKIDQIGANLNGNAIPMPANTAGDIKVYGHVGPDGKLKADSANTGKLKDTSEQKISKIMNAFQNLVKFPDKPMHVGETFTQDMPLNLPMAGNNMAANSKAVYKLVSIADGNAYFDVTQSMDMSIPVKGSMIKLEGNGAGKMVYDLKNSFPTDFTTKMDLKINGKIDTLQIDATAMLNMEYKTIIN